MAIVENISKTLASLSSGRSLEPGEQANVDVTLPNEASMIAAGVLLVVNPDTAPNAPSTPPTLQPVLAPVVAVATSNVASRSGTVTVDSVALTAGQRVLLTGQSTASQDGVWVVQAAAWTRPTDFPAAGVITSCAVLALQGTVNANTLWQLQVTGSLTIDTTAQTWVQVSGGGGGSGVTAGAAATGFTPGALVAVDDSGNQADGPLTTALATVQSIMPNMQSSARVAAGDDAYTSYALKNLRKFIAWLENNDLDPATYGHIGEISWPNDTVYNGGIFDDRRAWNKLGARYFDIALQAGMWVTPWFAGTRQAFHWSGWYGPPHDTTVGAPVSVANSQAAVLEGATLYTGKLGINWEDGEQNASGYYGIPDGTTGTFSNAREGGYVFNPVGQTMVTDASGRTGGAGKGILAWGYGDAASYAFLASRPNLGHIRLTVRWERLQRTFGGALDVTELARLDAGVAAAGAAGLGVIIDLHNFGIYWLDNGTVGVAKSIGGATCTQADFVDLWTKLSTHYKTNAHVIGYELCNEPDSATGWTTVCQAAVTAIRGNGDTKLLIISPPVTATFDGTVVPFITDSANNYRYTLHDYFDTGAFFPHPYSYYGALAQQLGYVAETVPALAAAPVQRPTGTRTAIAAAVSDAITALEVAGIAPASVQGAEDFTGSDTTSIDNRGRWFGSAAIGISSDKGYFSADSDPAFMLMQTNLTDAAVRATLTLSGTRANIGVLGRCYNGATAFLSAYLNKASGADTITLNIGGSQLEQVTGAGLTLGATYELVLQMIGSAVTVFLNGVSVITHTLSGTIMAEMAGSCVHGIMGYVSSSSTDDDKASRFLAFEVDAAPARAPLYDAIEITPSSGDYTAGLADVGSMIEQTSSAANVVSFPSDADEAWPSGSDVEVAQTGSGQTTLQFAVGAAVLDDTDPSMSSPAYGRARHLPAANTWLVTGRLPTSVLSIPSPIRFYDMSRQSGSDGVGTATLHDYGTDGLDGSASSQPIYKAAIQNGNAVARFDGSPDLRQFAIPDLSALTAGHVFIALKINVDPPTDSASAGLWTMGVTSTSYFPYTDGVIYDDFGTDTRKTVGNPTPSLAAWHIYEVLSGPGLWTARLDGVDLFTTSSNTVAFPSSPILGRSLNGDFGAWMLFDAVQTDGNAAIHRAGLKATWGTP